MDLCETRIGKESTLAMSAPDRTRIGFQSICREKVDVAVPAGAKHHRVRRVNLELSIQ